MGREVPPFALVVRTRWEASYQDPIQFRQGDRIELTGEFDIWEGHRWVWAIAADGREGWIPDNLFTTTDGKTMAAADYSAQELSCEPGEALFGDRETHGWIWCTNERADSGWVPSRNVERLQDPARTWLDGT